MKGISKWELLGLPATVVFGAAYKLGVFEPLGITAEQLPDLMIVVFFLVALVRAGASRTAKSSPTKDWPQMPQGAPDEPDDSTPLPKVKPEVEVEVEVEEDAKE